MFHVVLYSNAMPEMTCIRNVIQIYDEKWDLDLLINQLINK